MRLPLAAIVFLAAAFARADDKPAGANLGDAQTFLDGDVHEFAKGMAERRREIERQDREHGVRRTWKSVLLIFRKTDLDYVDAAGARRHYTGALSSDEQAAAENAYREFPKLVKDITKDRVAVETQVVYVDAPVAQATAEGGGNYWLSPDDARRAAGALFPSGTFDSLMVHWSMGPIACRGWGLGTYFPDRSQTYAVIREASASDWRIPKIGEPWLHEWLHGASAFYRGLGYSIPSADADGGGSHGFTQDARDGWTPYYRELMTATVPESYTVLGWRIYSTTKGISPQAWSAAQPSDQRPR